ncbi:MAG: hypothetical protein AABY22_30580 [Nanoarchaeota archaeon]
MRKGVINKKEVINSYLMAALWTAELDEKTIYNVTLSSQKQAEKDINLFIKKAGSLLDGIVSEQIGHDFWLSRNHHGAGFFDRNLGEVGDKLQAISGEFKELNVFEIYDGTEVVIE